MTEFVIKIENNNPVGHPIAKENFAQAFPDANLNNLPQGFAFFERVPRPLLGPYEVHESTTYAWSGNKVVDVHNIRAMTAEEKLKQQNFTKSVWKDVGHASWIFDEQTCSFTPPVPRPNDGKIYRWDESTLSWILME